MKGMEEREDWIRELVSSDGIMNFVLLFTSCPQLIRRRNFLCT